MLYQKTQICYGILILMPHASTVTGADWYGEICGHTRLYYTEVEVRLPIPVAERSKA
jgi:hypothetical protein